MILNIFAISLFFVQSLSSMEIRNLWSVDVAKNYQFGSRRHEFASPLLLKNEIFQGGSDGKFFVLNKDAGSVKRTIKDIGGIDSAPLFDKGVLYFGNNEGYIKAFSYRTGEILWSQYIGFPVDSTPCISKGILTILSSNDILFGIDASTGKLKWTVKRDFPSKRPVVIGSSTPIIFDDTVYVGFSDGIFVGANLFDGSVVFEKNLNSKGKFLDVDATPYVTNQIILVPSYDGSLYCLDRKSGKTLWTIKDGSAKSVMVAPDDKTIAYYPSDEGYLYAINIKDGIVRWRTKLSKGIPTTPVIIKDYIIVGSSERGIMIFDKKTGKYLSEFNSGRGVFANPVVEGNNLYFFSNYAVLYALEIK